MGVLRIGIRSSSFEKVTFNIKPEADPTLSIFQKHCLKKETTGPNGLTNITYINITLTYAKSHVTTGDSTPNLLQLQLLAGV